MLGDHTLVRSKRSQFLIRSSSRSRRRKLVVAAKLRNHQLVRTTMTAIPSIPVCLLLLGPLELACLRHRLKMASIGGKGSAETISLPLLPSTNRPHRRRLSNHHHPQLSSPPLPQLLPFRSLLNNGNNEATRHPLCGKASLPSPSVPRLTQTTLHLPAPIDTATAAVTSRPLERTTAGTAGDASCEWITIAPG